MTGGVGARPATPAPATAETGPAATDGRPGRRRRRLARPGPALAVLAGLLLAALGLRLWAIDHGLPWAFNPDEELHFVPVAVDMFRGSFNPGYFENPPALTYLLHAVFRLRFATGFPFGGTSFPREFAADPAAAYLTARVVVAVLGTGAVALAYWAGRHFHDRRVGLVAAALLAFAFLPVFYSKQALNDVVTLLPVTAALVASLLVLERGRLLDWALAGAAVGAATATKYTAGAMLVTLGVAALLRLRRDEDDLRAAAIGVAAAGGAFVAAFFALNPFALVDLREFASQVRGQSGQAGAAAKLGQEDVPGWLYYAWTVTWGLGAVPALAAVAGAVLALRADVRRGLLLVAFPVVLFLFLGGQARFFGRWLLPAYPMIALLAAYATVRAADALHVRERWRPAVVAGLALVLVGQGLVSSIRVSSVLEERDTRTLMRAWMERHVPRGAGVAIEPFIPADFLTTGDRAAPERYRLFPVRRPFQGYERRIGPALIDRYRAERYCWVVVASHQKQRGLKAELDNARAYYRRLGRVSERVAVFSPFEADTRPVPFNFDLSFNYQPPEYLRPGPLIEVHRLRGCLDA